MKVLGLILLHYRQWHRSCASCVRPAWEAVSDFESGRQRRISRRLGCRRRLIISLEEELFCLKVPGVESIQTSKLRANSIFNFTRKWKMAALQIGSIVDVFQKLHDLSIAHR